MPNALALVPKSAAEIVAATIRTVFLQPDAATAREQGRRVVDGFRPRFPRLAELLDSSVALSGEAGRLVPVVIIGEACP